MFIVTGATGHIGNTLVRLLLSENQPVKVLARQTGKALEGLPVSLSLGDIFDPAFLENEVSAGDVFIHSAGLIDLTNKRREECFRINDRGTRIIADFCQVHRIRLVYISSVDAIWKTDSTAPVREPDRFFPDRFPNDYSASKAAGTAYVQELMDHRGLDAVILYPSAVIGPYDFKPSAAGHEIETCFSRKLLFYIKGGYNFIDVRDTAMAIYRAATLPVQGGYILSGTPVTIRDFFREIARVLGRRVFLVRVSILLARIGAFFMHDISNAMVDALIDNYNYSNERMRKDLLPTLRPFAETVKDTVEWFRSHPTP